MTSASILLIVLSLLLCGLAAAQSDGCPAKEPEEWSPCGPDQANVSCNLGEAYGGDPYCWKACDGEWWTHFCAEAPPPDNGGKGEKGGDGDERGPQKPFQCSSLPDCDSCWTTRLVMAGPAVSAATPRARTISMIRRA